MLYIRMLFGMLVSLYTSRVVLQALGVEDYGIYNVVGGFVAMFSLISSSLSTSTSRFLTFELGKEDIARLKSVFSSSLTIHACLVLIVLLLSETIGVWFLNNQMTIPDNRLYAANWVFQASILAFMLGLFSVPYNASIIAHERMKAFAYIGVLDVVLKLMIVLAIAHLPLAFDRLIIYACSLSIISLSIQLIYLFYCRHNFEECRFQFCLDKAYFKKMGSFAGWNFIGSTSAVLNNYGVNILLNLFIGPVINAARGISTTVSSAICSFAGNFMMALNPQITKSYASGNHTYMMYLIERGSRFSFYILLILILPILFETNYVLTLWLKIYPEHTPNFIKLMLLVSLCDVFSNTLITLQQATGNIRDYQLAVGGMQLMNFPLSYLCLVMGVAPESIYFVALVISALSLLLRLFFLRRMVGLSIKQYLHNVCVNSMTVAGVAILLPSLFYCSMQEDWRRFVIVIITCVLNTCISIYFVGCSYEERLYIKRIFISFRTRLFGMS